MHVVREGGEYLGRQERRLWWYFGGNAAAVLFALAVAFAYPRAILAIPVAFALANTAASRLARVRRGRLGERLVTNLLKRLPDDYCLVNDVMIDGGIGNIDHVVVGPCGVVIIETKRVFGRINCDSDDWYINGFKRGSISRRVKRNALALRRVLSTQYPDAYSGFIEGVVVFTHPLCRLEVRDARATVVRYSELLQLMLDLGRRRRLSAEMARRIAEVVASRHVRTAPAI